MFPLKNSHISEKRVNVNPCSKKIERVFGNSILRESDEFEHVLKEAFVETTKTVVRMDREDAPSLGQPPITFLRQVMSLVAYPTLMNSKIFPEDAKLRAKEILEGCSGKSVGSYSAVDGMEIVRRQIAKFIEKEDGVECHWENCYIGQGALDMAKNFLCMIITNVNGIKSGILNPVPGCSSYSGLITELGLEKIDYYIDEDNLWSINMEELQRAIDGSKSICNPRAIIVINPGNPTSHILTKNNMEEIVRIAYKENLIIIADEIYRTSILKKDCSFIPFRKVLMDLGKPYSEMELVTLMSMSDGVYAENGFRCGFSEIKNLGPEIPPMIYKSLSISPPSCNLAQAALYCIVNPPKPNETSSGLFEKEKTSIIHGLQVSAKVVENTTKFLEGMTCNYLEGGLFFYPSIKLPEKAIKVAEDSGFLPDEFYALELLRISGICVVPGSELGQKSGTHHIRMTLTSNPSEMGGIMEKFKEFHLKFMEEYSK